MHIFLNNKHTCKFSINQPPQDSSGWELDSGPPEDMSMSLEFINVTLLGNKLKIQLRIWR
jgi:hypothetical protein